MNKMIKMSETMTIVNTYGITSCSPFIPTSGVTSPPNANCDNPNKLEALPAPRLLFAIAIENPVVPIAETGLTKIKKPIISIQIDQLFNNVRDTIITPIICTKANTFINVCSSKRSTNLLTNYPENIKPSPLKANIQLKAKEETPYTDCTINGDAEI